MVEPPPDVPAAEEAIRKYLRAHPHALDTERGIREWWLAAIQPRCTPGVVHAAVQRLVSTGELVERTLPDGQRAYALPQPCSNGPN